MVGDEVTFRDHETKIQTALNEIGLDSDYIKLVPFDYPKNQFFPNSNIPIMGALTPKKGFEDGLMNMKNRIDILLVNVENRDFANGIGEQITAIMIIKGIEAFQYRLREWRRRLST